MDIAPYYVSSIVMQLSTLKQLECPHGGSKTEISELLPAVEYLLTIGQISHVLRETARNDGYGIPHNYVRG